MGSQPNLHGSFTMFRMSARSLSPSITFTGGCLLIFGSLLMGCESPDSTVIEPGEGYQMTPAEADLTARVDAARDAGRRTSDER